MSRVKMLHDHQGGGKISRKRGQYLAQRLQTACRCGKGHDVEGAAESSWLLRIILYRNRFFLFANKAADRWPAVVRLADTQPNHTKRLASRLPISAMLRPQCAFNSSQIWPQKVQSLNSKQPMYSCC